MKKFFAGTFVLILISLFAVSQNASCQEITSGKYHKALIIGAHPDDPESMCGGTILALKDIGCEVVCVYFTQGEGGIRGKSEEEARTIRHQEALNSCALMGVRPVFMTQIDGRSQVNAAAYDEMKALIDAEKPDLVITHWPMDQHRDHRHCALCVFDSWRRSGHAFDLYYAEVMTGNQTLTFNPTTYVDITKFREKKLEAYLCHKSQLLEGNIAKYHDPMEEMRGLEFQCKYAEAFVRQNWNRK